MTESLRASFKSSFGKLPLQDLKMNELIDITADATISFTLHVLTTLSNISKNKINMAESFCVLHQLLLEKWKGEVKSEDKRNTGAVRGRKIRQKGRVVKKKKGDSPITQDVHVNTP